MMKWSPLVEKMSGKNEWKNWVKPVKTECKRRGNLRENILRAALKTTKPEERRLLASGIVTDCAEEKKFYFFLRESTVGESTVGEFTRCYEAVWKVCFPHLRFAYPLPNASLGEEARFFAVSGSFSQRSAWEKVSLRDG
jgi:hypothetical protein